MSRAAHGSIQLNRALQSFMYTMLSDANAMAAKLSLDAMVQLYRKSIWCV
jgi:protein SDA1